MSALQNEIGKLKTLKESFSNLADSVANQKETNENILTLLSQFGESVLQEKVTVILNCQESIVWQDYVVNVTFDDGRVQAVPLSENGTCSFSIKIGQNYSVQLPVIGTFIAPTLKTYTAISSARDIYWSYVAMGVFGMDELGRRYSIEQIEALEDKSIIKYGGYTDEYLENYQKADGTYGCGFMWVIDDFEQGARMALSLPNNTAWDESLLPFVGKSSDFAATLCDGEVYTRYIISENNRLNNSSPACEACVSKTISINKVVLHGYLPSYGQFYRMLNNYIPLENFYSAINKEFPENIYKELWLAGQKTVDWGMLMHRRTLYTANFPPRTEIWRVFVIFNLA